MPEEANQLEAYTSKGLTADEAQIVAKYVEDGKPGLAKTKADSLATIYLLGYSCQEINRMFPEYTLPLLLYARVYYGWDAARNTYLAELQKNIVQTALTTKLDSTKFVSEMLAATHLKWRKQIMAYLANPDREDPPACLPNTIHGYKETLGILQELTQPNDKAKGPAPLGGVQPATSPLVSVTISSAPATTTVTSKAAEGKPDIEVKAEPVPAGKTAAEIRQERADAVRKRPRPS